VQPRLWTPPLRDLDDPAASWGYDFIAFCDRIGWPLDPWQRWLAVHLGELFPDGSPRYRKAIVLVARQNGKTIFSRLLILYWLFVERVPYVHGTHKDRGEAKRSWAQAVDMAEHVPLLASALPEDHLRLQISEEDFWTIYGSHYGFSAPNRNAGRGKTVHRALVDELLAHQSRDCWNALIPGMNALSDALAVCISNEGDEASIVLHEEYDSALEAAESGDPETDTFLAAWSAPTGADPEDLEALACANPSLNRPRPNGTGITARALLGEARKAKRAGGRTLATFKIEMMCMRIDELDPAIRPEDWTACGVPVAQAVDLAQHRRQLALCFDVSQDTTHATLAAAATIDGITWIEILRAWSGYDARKRLRAELPDLLDTYRPHKCLWFPGGPAASVADEWHGRRVRNVIMEEIYADDVVRACMGLEEQAAARHIRHTRDQLLDLQIRQSQQLPQGDGWRFVRRGKLPIDASYAAAGAVHAARTIPRLGPAV
jgi:phage terminase large subunit-like protein